MHPGFVIIKILNPNAQQNTTLRERFYRESQSLYSTLNHPRIIKVLDVGITTIDTSEYGIHRWSNLDQYLKKKELCS